MGTDEFANMVYTDLSGPVFCDDPTYVPAEANAECKGKKNQIVKNSLYIFKLPICFFEFKD